MGSMRQMPQVENVKCADFNIQSLPLQWFCYMSPFNGNCETPEQQMEAGVVTVAAMRRQHESEKSQTNSGQSSLSPKVNVTDGNCLDSHADDSWRKNTGAKCEDWGQKDRRSMRMPKRINKLNSSASTIDLKVNHRRDIKRERNFKSTRPPQGRKENSYDQKAEVRTQKFFHDARGHSKKDYRAYHD